MAMACINGARECDGTCTRCHTEPEVIGYCAQCKEAIYETDDRYDIEGVALHDDCLRDWAKQFRVVVI